MRANTAGTPVKAPGRRGRTAGGGSDLAGEDQTYEITVCDTFRDIASVRVDSHEYVDYLHLAKVAGSWKIVHDLWQLKQGDLPDR